MSFPKKPERKDELRSALMRLMEVPQYPQVYVLGCFARYVTVYAQQVRALNLIDCLCKSGILSARSRLAIVGGGIAGMTAAGAASVRGVREVTLFEKTKLLQVQSASQHRYIHPHIYDWPSPDAFEESAGLPLFDWSADRAQTVVEKMFAYWERSGLKDRIRTVIPSTRVSLRIGKAGPELSEGDSYKPYTAVILATGFGRDSSHQTDSYWTDSRIDGSEAETEGEWLVSGVGDGALTDLMRLCISGFRHQAVLSVVDQEARQRVGASLLAAVAANLSDEQMADRFDEAGQSIARSLNEKFAPRPIAKVWLNATRSELFSSKASVLNRLIVAWLRMGQRFELLAKPGWIQTESGDLAGLRVPAEIPPGVIHTILRHGPNRNTRFAHEFPDLYAHCADMERLWRSSTQYDDWTKEPLYQNSDFQEDAARNPKLRVDFGDDTGCIVIGRSLEPAGRPLKNRVQAVLEGKFARFARQNGLRLIPEPEEFSSIRCFRDPAEYERTVRAICHSPIAVFDLTDYEPAVLLLLGIRAAARRGITLTVSEEPRLGRKLPFNIMGLNPIALGKDSSQEIQQALVSGFGALRAQPNVYLDLPAYDALRKLGEGHRALEPEEQILVLRWFDPQYAGMVKELVEDRLPYEGTSVVTNLDSRSPQLAEQRLYAAIRRTRLCIADWTGWRSNVFFETGVRLAINPTDPILIRCTEKPLGWNNKESGEWPAQSPTGAKELEEFFGLVHFTLESDEDLKKALAAEKWGPMECAKLSTGRTFSVVQESIDRRLEAGATPVDEILAQEAKALAGDFVPGEGNSIPVVFPDSLGKQASHAAMEHLIAAWFYLNHRYQLLERRKSNSFTTVDQARFDRLEEIFVSINSLRLKFPDSSDTHILDRIAQQMGQAREPR